MPLSSPPQARPVTRRTRRILALAGGILVAGVVAVIAWAAFTPGSRYGSSKNGCITVTLPSSTGGAFVHECGGAAKATCRSAFTHTDRVSLLTRPQCRLAGLTSPP
jgi:hypothetical protein